MRPGVTPARSSAKTSCWAPVSRWARADGQTGGRKARGCVLLWQLVPTNLQLVHVIYWWWINSQCYGWTTHAGDIRHLWVWQAVWLQADNNYSCYITIFLVADPSGAFDNNNIAFQMRMGVNCSSCLFQGRVRKLVRDYKAVHCGLWKKEGWIGSARSSSWKVWIIKLWFALWPTRGSNLRGWGWLTKDGGWIPNPKNKLLLLS